MASPSYGKLGPADPLERHLMKPKKVPAAAEGKTSNKNDGIVNAKGDPLARLGAAVRTLRRLRELTVQDLAEAVGVDKAHISRIERGQKTPSIATMARLASALGVSIGHLMGETLDRSDVRVTRGLDQAGQPLVGDEPSVHQFVPLLHGRSVGAFESFIVYPGNQPGTMEATHDGQEMVYVLTGTVDLLFPGHTERLQTGDCAHFPGYLPHRIARVGRTRAKLLIVVSAK